MISSPYHGFAKSMVHTVKHTFQHAKDSVKNPPMYGPAVLSQYPISAKLPSLGEMFLTRKLCITLALANHSHDGVIDCHEECAAAQMQAHDK